METVDVPLTLKDESFLPTYGTELASGADVRAFIEQEITVLPGASVLVPTGIHFAIPDGYEIQVRPRSGLALKHQITILNSPGTIDADYRGELGIILINHGKNPFVITRGMRLAQIVLAAVIKAEFRIVQDLVATSRGDGGFGHTGTH